MCLGQRSEAQMMEERDEEMRSKYYDPIEHFPDRIDQLLDALNRVSDLIVPNTLSVELLSLDLYGSTKIIIT